ncbi:MAG: hypothetical protein AAF483_19065 [Planctomycetota bacterium]
MFTAASDKHEYSAQPNASKEMFSWEIIESEMNPMRGPLSKTNGFMPDPESVTKACVVLPAAWEKLWRNLPKYYIRESLRDYCEQHLEPIDVDQLYQSVDIWSFIKSKSVVFNIAQAWVDCAREIGDTEAMPEPPALPSAIQETMEQFVRITECLDYCTLADMCLTSAEVVAEDFDPLHAHYDELQLLCPVNGAPTKEEERSGDLESARVRGIVENRFHLMPTIMEYRTSDLPSLVAQVQKMIHTYEKINHVDCRKGIAEEVVALLGKIKQSFSRLREAMTFVKRDKIDPVVWHRDVVKFTAGYGGHAGSSGPQTPVIHLIDAFLGRTAYGSELGEMILSVRKQIQQNHQVFVRSVELGPNMRGFAAMLSQEDPQHPVVVAFNDMVEEYVRGFLSIHHGKAVMYANAGFGETDTPRIFTAGTKYFWPNTNSVTTKLRNLFTAASNERSKVKVEESSNENDCPPAGVMRDLKAAGFRCPVGLR